MTNFGLSTASMAVMAHFEANLDKGWGDLETMIAGIWFRVKNNADWLDPSVIPSGYRGTRLRNYLKEVCGARRTTKWGATALRGDLKKTKQHIVVFYELVNAIPESELELVLEQVGRLYAQKINAETPEIILEALSSVQQTLVTALRTTGSLGKIQQGLVYAALEFESRVHHSDFIVFTKPTHAGDLQSGTHGDVLLLKANIVLAAYEVKASMLTQTMAIAILETHGRHTYPLFIVVAGFQSASLQDMINSNENTFAVHLTDFILTLMGELQAHTGLGLNALIRELVNIYNREFCARIEQDNTIMIRFADDA